MAYRGKYHSLEEHRLQLFQLPLRERRVPPQQLGQRPHYQEDQCPGRCSCLTEELPVSSTFAIERVNLSTLLCPHRASRVLHQVRRDLRL